MKLKKILAAVAAAAVAVSTMAITAFAGLTNYPDGCTIDLIADGYNVMDVYGFTFNISGSVDDGVGGGVGFNSASTGWESHEWGNTDSGKEILITDGKVTLLKDAPVFKETDVTDPTNPYAQVWMQHWWGVDVTVDSVDILGADGVVLTPAAAPAETEAETTEPEAEATEAATEEEAAPAEEEAEDEDVDEDIDVDVEEEEPEAEPVAETEAPAVEEVPAPVVENATSAPATGNTATASIVAVMAVAGVAAIAAKKRK